MVHMGDVYRTAHGPAESVAPGHRPDQMPVAVIAKRLARVQNSFFRNP